MPETGARDAVAAADRLRRAVGVVRYPAGHHVEITFGVASTADEGCRDSDGLLSGADQALYSAKAQGRNRTVAYAAPTVAFFFSSRRRHTRFDCDWSSDVCSSDLRPHREHLVERAPPGLLPLQGEAIDQVEVDALPPHPARSLDQGAGLAGRLDPVHGALHVGIEVLDTDRKSVV